MRKSNPRSSRSSGRGAPKGSGRFSIGIHAVTEALKVHPQWSKELWIKEGSENSSQMLEILKRAKSYPIKIQNVPVRRLDELGSGHQGVALCLSEAPELDENLLNDASCVCLALDQVSDPHNLGAILRTAWLLKARAIFVPKDRSVSLTPTVSKVAQGGVEHVPVVKVSSLEQELKHLKDKGFWIFGLSHKATSHLFEMKLPEKVVWVMGAEGGGMRKPVERACDELVSIPQASAEASFNVSVATGLALAESYRQLFFPKASK